MKKSRVFAKEPPLTSDKNQKTLFLDIRNVLLFYDFDKMTQQIANYCQIETSLVKGALQNQNWGEKYEKGEIDSWTLFHQLPTNIQGSKGFAGWMDAISNIFSPNLPLVPVIKKLKNNKIKLFTLSNICEAHFGYAYTHFPVLHLFDGHILSYEIGVRAPDPKIYQIALEKASAPEETTLYVSANPEYVYKAKELQIDSEVYTQPDTFTLQLQQKQYLL